MYTRRRKKFSQSSSALTELNVTPLLDLAFILLIIFMITTPLVEKTISVDIPTSDAASQAVDADAVKIIEANKSGEIFFDGTKLSLEELGQELIALKAATPDPAILIRGDQILKLQELVNVIDAIQKAGITKFGIITTPSN